MKKIVFLSVFMFLATFSFAQQKAIVSSLKAFDEAKSNDVYSFELSEKMTKERVTELSDYYTRYFTTSFDEKKNTVTVKLNDTEYSTKMVVRRLFAGMGIDEVLIEGKTISTDTFFADYILK
ncbi:MAG TPA: hypothetical protein PLP27_09620 [Crocinitomicaceae bacterium]|nr:hypothetical protein [Crocinitomicaceae bacterium]